MRYLKFSHSIYMLMILCLNTIHADAQSFNPQKWRIELEQPQNSSVYFNKDTLTINSSKGATVWLDSLITGNYEITYKRTFIMEGAKNDRLSDMNQFWNASDGNGLLKERKGQFREYDDMLLYYFGISGNKNTTSRLRRYDGKGERVLLQDLDTTYLLKPGKVYTVKTVISNGRSQVWVDDRLYFDYTDSNPIKSGYFGLRTTHSHQKIWDFKIKSIRI